jgi:ankyrin repeat protein
MRDITASELYYLISGSEDKEASELIASGVDFSANLMGVHYNALTLAINKGKLDLVSQMIAKAKELGRKEWLDKQDGYERSPLFYAIYKEYDEVVRQLLDAGANVNQVAYRSSALTHAAAKGSDKIVRILLENGADATIVDKNGRTALTAAAAEGFMGIVRQLLLTNVNINACENYLLGYTALMHAVQRGDEEMVDLLLLAGCDVNKLSSNGDTALIIAAQMAGEYDYDGMGSRTNILRKLLLAGADVNIENRYGKTVLSFAGSKVIKDLIRTYERDPVSFYVDNLSDFLAQRHISLDALPVLVSQHGPEVIKKIIQFFINHNRADLIYQVISKNANSKNLESALQEKVLVKDIYKFLASDSRNDKAENYHLFDYLPASNQRGEIAAARKEIDAKLDVINTIRSSKFNKIEYHPIIRLISADKTVLAIKRNEIVIDKPGEPLKRIPHNLSKKEIINELLLQAIDNGNYPLATTLMKEHGAQLGIRKKDGISYFYYIANKYYTLLHDGTLNDDDLKALKELYRTALFDPSIDINATIAGQTLLHAALAAGLETEAAILILRGIDPLIKDKHGKIAADYLKPKEKERDLFKTDEASLEKEREDHALKKKIYKNSAAEIQGNASVMQEVLESYSVEEIEKIVQATGKQLDEVSKAKLNALAAQKAVSTQAPRIVKEPKETKENKAQEKRVQSLDDDENFAIQVAAQVAQQEEEQEAYKKDVTKLCERIEKHAQQISPAVQESIGESIAMVQGKLANKTWGESVYHGPARLDYQPPKASDRRMYELDKLSTVIDKLAKNDGSNRAIIVGLKAELAKIYSTHKIEKIRGDSNISRSS